MAGLFSDVRFAICAVAAAHMRSFTKSSQLVGAECKFRGLAMQAMVIEVQRVLDKDGGAAPGRFEGLVASSKLLAWEAPSRYDVLFFTTHFSFCQSNLSFLDGNMQLF